MPEMISSHGAKRITAGTGTSEAATQLRFFKNKATDPLDQLVPLVAEAKLTSCPSLAVILICSA